MFDICRIYASAIGQYPSFLLAIERNLIAIENGFLRLRIFISETVDEEIILEGQFYDFGSVFRGNFLILNAKRFQTNDWSFGT